MNDNHSTINDRAVSSSSSMVKAQQVIKHDAGQCISDSSSSTALLWLLW